MKNRMFALLLMLSMILGLAACGNQATTEAVPSSEETTIPETSAAPDLMEPDGSVPIPETTEETVPEPETPPMYFPAMDNGKYIFGIELYNDGDFTATITSMVVTDFLEETLVRENTLTKTQIEQANGDRPADLNLLPGTSSVEFLEVRPGDVDFDQRVLTVTTTDTEGTEVTHTIAYTMDESKATPRVHPDDEEWIAPFLRTGGVDFPCVIENTTDETLYLKIYNAQCYMDCVPLRTRAVTQIAKLKMQDIAQIEPGETVTWFQNWPSSYRWTHRKDTLIYEDSQGNTYPMVYRFTGPQENPKSDAVVDAYLRYRGIADQRQLSVSDIEKMLAENLTLEETAQKISTIADFWQYLYIKEYQSSDGDLKFQHEGTQWHANRSAQVVFQENKGNCGGGSRLANKILEGDYDEQGYILEVGNKGGHIYNYFRKDGLYYVVDFTKTAFYGKDFQLYYQISIVEDLQEFSDAYIAENHRLYAPNANHYLLLQYSIPTEGRVPILGGSPMYCLFEEFEGKIRVLYQLDERTAPQFVPAPPMELWPADTLEPAEALQENTRPMG